MEKVDVYNKFRERTEKIKGRKELTIGEYRISTHIWIKDSKDRLLIEKRSEKEDKFPGMWAQVGPPLGIMIRGVAPTDRIKRYFLKEETSASSCKDASYKAGRTEQHPGLNDFHAGCGNGTSDAPTPECGGTDIDDGNYPYGSMNCVRFKGSGRNSHSQPV